MLCSGMHATALKAPSDQKEAREVRKARRAQAELGGTRKPGGEEQGGAKFQVEASKCICTSPWLFLVPLSSKYRL